MLSVSYTATNDELVVNGGAGNDTINITRGGNFLRVDYTDGSGSHSDTFWDAIKPVARIKAYGLDGRDLIRADGAIPRTTVWGGNGDDTINFAGLTINAAIFQSNVMWGGAGNDVITGSVVYDAIHGDAGADSLTGGDFGDAIFGGDGNDTARGGTGGDWLYGDNNDDQLFGDAGNDHLYGLNGNDLLRGGAENDSLDGGSGADNLQGEAGNDWFGNFLDGSSDTAIGGAGADVINGMADPTDSWMQ